jgi:trehalose 6-phosphate phosphatase
VDALVALRRNPASTALFLDFDGTLAPIVAVASEARPLPGTTEVLLELADRYAVVAVVSGRPVAFLAEHLPAAVEWHGLYGLEAVIAGRPLAEPGSEVWRTVIDDVAESAERTGPRGLDVEHKGLSLTLHYRRQPELADLAYEWAAEAAARTGLHLRAAKMSLELHPPVAVDKGTVVMARAAGMSAAVYIGDDEGDLPAFAALDQLASAGVEAVKVAVLTPEVSPLLLAQADVRVDGPAGALDLLRQLT